MKNIYLQNESKIIDYKTLEHQSIIKMYTMPFGIDSQIGDISRQINELEKLIELKKLQEELNRKRQELNVISKDLNYMGACGRIY